MLESQNKRYGECSGLVDVQNCSCVGEKLYAPTQKLCAVLATGGSRTPMTEARFDP